MSNISDLSLSFRIVRNYVVFCFKRYYGEYIVIGRENIPYDCPIIFAPNHINALMDAIAVHSVVPANLPVIFLARADIFNNKTAAKILKFTKIVPAFRMRDGVENLGKNNEIFEQCVGILNQNKALGIMPEGNQGEQRKLRPLVKGIFRISFAAQLPYHSNPKVKIIPIGIDYGDLVKFGKHIIINIGKPIEVSDYMTNYAENPVSATNEIRDKLRKDLSNLSLNLASENHYECFEEVTEIANNSILKKMQLPDETVYRFAVRKKIGERLLDLEINNPEKINELESLRVDYTKLLKTLNLKTWVLDQNIQSSSALILEGLKLFWTLPFYIYGFILNFLPFFIPVYLRKHIIKAQYEGFFSSLQFGLGIFTFPIFYILQTILFCCFVSTSWWGVMLFFILQYPFGKWAIKWNREMKKFIAKLRFKKMIKNKTSELLQAQSLRDQIIRIIS